MGRLGLSSTMRGAFALAALACLAASVAAGKKDYSIKIKNKVVGSPTVLELKSGSDAADPEAVVNYQFTNDGAGRLVLTSQIGVDAKKAPALVFVGKPPAASFLELSEPGNATNASITSSVPAGDANVSAKVFEKEEPTADPADRSEQDEKDENAALPPVQGGTKTAVQGKMRVMGKGGKSSSLMTTSAFSVAGASQWVLLSHEDFGEIKDWVRPNGKKVQEGVTCFQGGDDGAADNFLGPRFGPSADCQQSFFSASKTYTLPAHTEVMITGRYHFIDQWTGTMHGFAKTDGVKRWVKQYEYCTKMFSAFCREYSISVCGDERYPEKLSERFSFSFPHTKASLKLEVGMDTMTGNAPTCTQVKSWGVDDIQVWIKRA